MGDTKDKETTAEEAMKVLEKAQKERVDMCNKEIGEILKKYGFSIRIDQVLTLVPLK